MQVTTAVFTVWFFTYLYRWDLAAPLATGFGGLHGVVDVVPAVSEPTIQDAVLSFVTWGLGLSVVLFFVAFGLFHRAMERER